MTLAEALARARSVPLVGDFEFVRRIGGSGVTHKFIVVSVGKDRDGTPVVDYTSRCGEEMNGKPEDYEVATGSESCNCIRCML